GALEEARRGGRRAAAVERSVRTAQAAHHTERAGGVLLDRVRDRRAVRPAVVRDVQLGDPLGPHLLHLGPRLVGGVRDHAGERLVVGALRLVVRVGRAGYHRAGLGQLERGVGRADLEQIRRVGYTQRGVGGVRDDLAEVRDRGLVLDGRPRLIGDL